MKTRYQEMFKNQRKQIIVGYPSNRHDCVAQTNLSRKHFTTMPCSKVYKIQIQNFVGSHVDFR